MTSYYRPILQCICLASTLLPANYACSQLSETKYLFFDFLQDSLKARTLRCAAPTNIQTFSLNNSLVTDYIGNARISIITGVITGKKDTVLALHRLVNGAGNFAIDLEYPFVVIHTRQVNQRDFIGSSINPRVSTVISNNNTFETSMVSYDLGWNITGQFSGDLGNILLKYTLRNAICSGNNRFVQKVFEFEKKEFIYTSVQLKIRAGPNIFSLNYPIYVYSLADKMVNDLPVYVGYALLF
jgi:hypothetical protein